MLLSVSVANHRSFNTEQTVDFGISCGTRRQHHEASENTRITSKPLSNNRICIVFGRPGTGKTNFANAIWTIKQLLDPNHQRVQHYESHFQPFLFSDHGQIEPTVISITLWVNGSIYRFKLSYTAAGLFEESLEELHDEPTRPDLLFRCRWDCSTQQPLIKADRHRLGAAFLQAEKEWKCGGKRTIPLLSWAAKLGCAPCDDVQRWITTNLIVVSQRSLNDTYQSSSPMKEQEDVKLLLGLMKTFDQYIQSFNEIKTEGQNVKIKFSHNETIAPPLNIEFKRSRMLGESIATPVSMESQGTTALFRLGTCILNALKYSQTLVIDEMLDQLPTDTVTRLFRLILDYHLNDARAQLLFTTFNHEFLTHSCIDRKNAIIFQTIPSLETEAYRLETALSENL
ncbi:MAG: hypothetical protein EBT07_05850 [Actinobacteria bacterium]|nr:hypothetical protein [Actinomycetota bacterium]